MTGVRAILAVIGMVLAGSLARGGPAEAADYHIDSEKGDDRRDGLSPESAWRHAPGDSNATGRPATTVLRPGDSLLFASGVRYRGAIKLNGGGSAGNPVVITTGPGAAPAIIDGTDPVSAVRACRSADDCGGSPHWRKLVRADFDAGLPANAALFTEAGLLFPAQSPHPSDPLNADNAAEYLRSDPAKAMLGAVALPPALAKSLDSAGESRLLFELYGNEIAIRDIIAIEGSDARFDPQGLRFNTDRPLRFAVLLHPSLVLREGEYGLLAGGRTAIIHMPASARSLSLSNGRGGIDLSGHSYVKVSRLAFENMADVAAGAFSGVAIVKSSAGSDIVVEDNRFKNLRLQRGTGPLALNFITRLAIRNNDIHSIVFGSGMRLYKNTDVEIAGNTISRIGRTGIMLINSERVIVARNTITHARGIHGNALTAYQDNRNVRFVDNFIAEALRPVTIGHASAGLDNALTFERNVIVGTFDSLGAITSWGNARGVTITDNLLLGGKAGLDLAASDTGIAAFGNVVSGPTLVKHRPARKENAPGYIPEGWRLGENRRIAFNLRGSPSAAASGLEGAVADALSGGRTGAWRRLCEILPGAAQDASGRRIGASLDCAAH